MRAAFMACLAAALAAATADAQWLNHPSKDIPRTRDGKPNLSAKAPKVKGKPDLSGVWLPEPDPAGKPEGVENEIFPRYFVNIAADLKFEEVPLQPAALDLLKQRLQSEGRDAPESKCVPPGVPGVNTFPLPYKIIQTPKVIAILYEHGTTFRQVFMDGRPLPADPQPSFMGYSVGRWEGDTLIVESNGFRDQGWLDRMGHPHSDGLRLVERIRRTDFGHVEMEMSINDPRSYTRPITYTQKATLIPDGDLLEYYCTENEKDVAHFSK